MAHQEQYLNKVIVLLMLTGCMFGCQSPHPDNLIRVSMSDMAFKQQQGILYYHKTPFTGIVYELFTGGDSAKSIPYINGKQQGLMRYWHQNKQIAQERFFANGKKQGLHKGWWPNGKLQFEYNFINDEHEGEAKEWFSNGKLFRIFHYVKGHEEGSQKMWWEDGKIRANYVIIDGEKFGLFGQKLCLNTLKK